MRLRFPDLVRMLILSLLALASLFPIYFVLVNSVKTTVQFSESQILLPDVWQWSNYSLAWAQIARPIINSCIIVFSSVVGIVLLASLSAYAFAILPLFGKRVLFGLIFVLLLIPGFLTLIPLFLQIKRLPFSDSYWAVILPYIAGGQAFAIFVLRTFFEGISKEVVEAARLDGAGDFRIYRSIAMPLSVPALISVGIINLVPLWNDYLLPQLLLDRAHRTVTMALVTFQGSAQSSTAPSFGPLMASYVLAAIPLSILFAFLMRYYVEGLTSGAVKL